MKQQVIIHMQGYKILVYVKKMDDFSAYAYLDADDESEISLIGYVTDSLGYDDAYANKYTFSASDQHGYSIGRQTGRIYNC